MARKEITQYFDDIDSTPLEEDQVRVVHFSYGKNDYTIDLSEENARRFDEVIRPYIENARKRVTPTQGTRRSTGQTRNSRAREIRQWALDQGKNVSTRGKIPADIIEAYNLAHS
ncbi:histone-like nucleoid-structuring protein Lsr2 [Corynebacterium otitidis]|uniref:Lsr2 family protein n=1 Tax=Corynebacterium otitidis ATCC 51513 TaxID=883169 RepID=K0YEA9_9CORY|nr:Lsr2 family protein [Corynebacterium otitidis]EJZ81601.1 hypothetical protein HMPREF9719_01468 [Corynebacterium otitidis ATCC 51513]KKO83213.1 histone [Corynebacterium otitidis]